MILRYGKSFPRDITPGTLVKWIRLDGQMGFGMFISYISPDPLRPCKVKVLTSAGVITEKVNMYFKMEPVQ